MSIEIICHCSFFAIGKKKMFKKKENSLKMNEILLEFNCFELKSIKKRTSFNFFTESNCIYQLI